MPNEGSHYLSDKSQGTIYTFSSRLLDLVRSETAALIRRPKSWRTIRIKMRSKVHQFIRGSQNGRKDTNLDGVYVHRGKAKLEPQKERCR